MNAQETIHARAAAGAEFLDEQNANWHEGIYPHELSMVSPCWCILGQVYGHFYDAMVSLGLNDDDAVRYGFSADGTLISKDAEYEMLDDCWEAEVTQRQQNEAQ